MSNESAFQSRLLRYWPWLAVGLVILLAGAIRWRLLDLPLERDEGEFGYAGQLIRQGIPPYQLAGNMKFPGTYLAYAVIMAAFGETTWGIHLGLLLVNAVSTVLVFLLGRRLMDNVAGVTAAWTFAALSANSVLFGFSGHATHFVVLFLLLGWLWLLDATPQRRSGRIFLAGVAFGLAILMKQHAALVTAFGALWLGLLTPENRGVTWPVRIRRLAGFVAGCALPLLLVGLWLWRAGAFEKFVFWTFTYATEYLAKVPLSRGWRLFSIMAPAVTKPSWGLWAMAGAGLVFLFTEKWLKPNRVFLTGLLVFSFASICPGFVFRNHYFILLLPAVALLSAVPVSAALRWRKSDDWRRAGAVVVPAIYLLAWAAGGFANRSIWFEKTTTEAARAIFNADQPFVEAIAVADYVRAHSLPRDRIAVLGSEPEIYFLSRRHSVLSFMYSYPLMEPQPYALPMQEQMIQEIKTARPQYVVYVEVFKSWLIRPTSPRRILEWWQTYAPAQYDLVGVVEMSGDGRSVSSWDEAVKNLTRTYGMGIMVYRLKEKSTVETAK